MKFNPLLKSGLGLLVIAGALAPVASLGTEAEWSFAEGALYDNLRNIESSPSMMSTEHGSQGPIRPEGMGPAWSYDEGAMYDNLRHIQAVPSMASAAQGAQGPIRTERMGATWDYNTDGATYDNLQRFQSEQ